MLHSVVVVFVNRGVRCLLVVNPDTVAAGRKCKPGVMVSLLCQLCGHVVCAVSIFPLAGEGKVGHGDRQVH